MVRRALIIVAVMAVWAGGSRASSASAGGLELRPAAADSARPVRLVGKHARQQLAVTVKLNEAQVRDVLAGGVDDPPPRDIAAVRAHDPADEPRAAPDELAEVSVADDPARRDELDGAQDALGDDVVHPGATSRLW